MKRHEVVRRLPLLQVEWSDLSRGDRVEHFDYGAGTVTFSGPIFIGISWDDPRCREIRDHDARIVRYLARIDPAESRS